MAKVSVMETTPIPALEECVVQAFNAGCPRDQVEGFFVRSYVPLPWQWKFHALARKADNAQGPTKIGIGGARGPGKSHAVFAQITLDDCQRVPGLKPLFLRQTGKAAQESFEDLLLRVLVGKIRYKYNSQTKVLKFPNGSRIILGGFQDERDIDQYIGIEYDLVAIEELNQLTQEKVDRLLGSMRTSKEGWRPRLYASFNPGGIGHQYVKKVFVDSKEDKTKFVPATYKDNPYLNPEYVEYLENLTGALGKAWREGNFDIFEGQYFVEWNRERHVIPPFPIPLSWRKFRAYDHGREAPACCLWFALDQDGRIWIYREFYASGLNVDQISQEVLRLSGNEVYDYSVADPSIFSKTGFVDRYGGQTIAETFARQGITFMPASNRRVDGWNLLHQYLHWEKDKHPRLIFFNTCYNSIRTLPTLIHDDRRPEDINTKGEDHVADCLRYFLLSLHERKSLIPMTEGERRLARVRQESEISPVKLNEFYTGENYPQLPVI